MDAFDLRKWTGWDGPFIFLFPFGLEGKSFMTSSAS